MNRLKDTPEPAEVPSGPGDYFVVETKDGWWYISTEMARFIDGELAATPIPEWVTFVDLSGSRIRLRTGRIDSLSQSTAEQRSANRAFQRSLRA
jgi:hypothetical protein